MRSLGIFAWRLTLWKGILHLMAICASFKAVELSGHLISLTVAWMLAEYPGEGYQQIINRVLRATDRLSALAGKCVTGERLNLRRALAPIRLTPPPEPSTSPKPSPPTGRNGFTARPPFHECVI